jgi:hypothetical protein
MTFARRQCNKCGGIFSEGFFRKIGRPEVDTQNLGPTLFNLDGVFRARNTKELRPTCIGCQQTTNDNLKREDRFVAKARSTIYWHAERLNIAEEVLRDHYGWTVERIAHLFRHGYENTCNYCFAPYVEMGHGFADITLDIVDPSKPPYLKTNVQTCCGTCNRSKSDMSPEQWELRQLDWKTWHKQQKKTPLQPDSQVGLFADFP